MAKKNIIIGITGASGASYARALLRALPADNFRIHLTASSAGRLVYRLETGLALEDDLPPGVVIYDEKDFAAPFSSGSFQTVGMAIVPCTMGTLASIAAGVSQNLIHRAADVCMKEGRRLVIVPRETPLNRIHLQNMLRLSEAGATILPAMPGFYHNPRKVDDLVLFIVARILEQFDIPQDLVPQWSGLVDREA